MLNIVSSARWRKYLVSFGAANQKEMSSTELLKKHFGNTTAVGMKHPNMESFFEELNAECLAEDKQKQCEHVFVYKILHDHTAKNVCEKCHLVINQ